MQLYTILSACNYIPYYPHANLYPIIPMQIYTILSPCKSIPYYPHGMITPPLSQCSLYLLLTRALVSLKNNYQGHLNTL